MDFQEAIFDALKYMRFERVQYKWSKYANDSQYFKMDALPDDILVIWEDGGQFRRID